MVEEQAGHSSLYVIGLLLDHLGWCQIVLLAVVVLSAHHLLHTAMVGIVVCWCRFVTVLVSNSSGWLADGLANSGTLTMTQTRKLLQVVGSVGPGEKGAAAEGGHAGRCHPACCRWH